VARNEEYDPDTDTWTTRQSEQGLPLWWPAATESRRRVHLLGGRSNGTTSSKINAMYDPETDTWSTGETMSDPARDSCAAEAF
jgi:hypothetical protein